jgi:acyl-CoA thioester hydrolase
MSRPAIPTRKDYRHFYPLETRWEDNDIYGHVNNVTYYSYFDTAANRYLIEEGGLDPQNAGFVGYVVNSGCSYHAPIAHPDVLDMGLRVDKLGNSSVTYGLAVFRKGEDQAAAHGHFVHVFVDRAADTAVAIPEQIRNALSRLLV